MSSTAVRYKLNTRLVFAGHAAGKKDNVLRKFSKQNDAEPVEKRFQGKVIFPIETLVLILYHQSRALPGSKAGWSVLRCSDAMMLTLPQSVKGFRDGRPYW